VFYGLYTVQIVVGAAVVLIPRLNLFLMMWISQVANAVLLPFVLVLMLRLANDVDIMGRWRNRRWMNVIVVLMTVLVSIATVALFTSG